MYPSVFTSCTWAECVKTCLFITRDFVCIQVLDSPQNLICYLLLVSAQTARFLVTHSGLCSLQVVRYMDSVGIFMDIGASRERSS